MFTKTKEGDVGIPTRIDTEGRLVVRNDQGVALQVSTAPGDTVSVSGTSGATDLAIDGAVATGVKQAGTAATYVLPEAGGLYTIIVKGGSAFFLENGTADDAIGTGFSFMVDDYYPVTFRLNGPAISYYSTGTPTVCFVHHKG